MQTEEIGRLVIRKKQSNIIAGVRVIEGKQNKTKQVVSCVLFATLFSGEVLAGGDSVCVFAPFMHACVWEVCAFHQVVL